MNKLALLFLPLVLLVGCAANYPKTLPIESQAQTNIAYVTNDLSIGDQSLTSAQTDLKSVTPSYTAINTNVTTAKTAIDHSLTLTPLIATEIGTISAQRDKLATYVDSIQNDWLGPKAHRVIVYVVIVAVLFAVGMLLLQLAPEIGIPALSGFSKIFGHVLTLGTGFLGKLITKISAFTINKVAPAVTTAVVATASATKSMLESAAPTPSAVASGTTPPQAGVPTSAT